MKYLDDAGRTRPASRLTRVSTTPATTWPRCRRGNMRIGAVIARASMASEEYSRGGGSVGHPGGAVLRHPADQRRQPDPDRGDDDEDGVEVIDAERLQREP